MRAPEAPTVNTTPAAPQAGPAAPANPGAGAATPPAADGHQHAGSSPIHFSAPEGWAESDRDVMFAEVVWDFPSGGGGTLSVVGGGVDANLDRWATPGQFLFADGDADANMTVEELEGCKYPTKLVTLKGTLVATKVIGGGPPREGWMLVGAGISGTPLHNDVYLKVAGPIEDMEAMLPAIREALMALDIH